MEWSQRRRVSYSIAFAGLLILLAAYPVYVLTSKPPTCFDKKKNGTETGLDCGGGCALACVAEVKPLRVVWSKVFPLGVNHYDIGVYVENPNVQEGVKNAHYTLRAYDSSGVVLSEKQGSTEIVPGTGFVLFEPNVVMSGEPNRVDVSFDEKDLTQWIKARVAPSAVSTKNQSLKFTSTKPRYDAILVNSDYVNDTSNLTVSVIVYDTSRIPVAISQTYANPIQKGGEQSVTFTWPNGFVGSADGFLTEVIITPRAIFVE